MRNRAQGRGLETWVLPLTAGGPWASPSLSSSAQWCDDTRPLFQSCFEVLGRPDRMSLSGGKVGARVGPTCLLPASSHLMFSSIWEQMGLAEGRSSWCMVCPPVLPSSVDSNPKAVPLVMQSPAPVRIPTLSSLTDPVPLGLSIVMIPNTHQKWLVFNDVAKQMPFFLGGGGVGG